MLPGQRVFSSKLSRSRRSWNPLSMLFLWRVEPGRASPMVGIGTISPAGLRMERPSTLFLEAMASSTWGIRFDPSAGKPVGQPFEVSKFDRPRLMIPRWIPSVGFSLTQDKVVLTMAQESGNIWVLDNVDR